ncbi:MAG: hypothetical protein AAF206_30765 [Bacteroidota bacterium]
MKSLKVILSFLLLGPISYPMMSQDYAPELRQLIERQYDHGIDPEIARSFGKTYLPQLYGMMADSAYQAYLTNIVSTIGMIGEPEAFGPLEAYFINLSGPVSYPAFVSSLTNMQAMGYLAKNGSCEALNFLITWADVDQWQQAEELDFSYQNMSRRQMADVLGRVAIQALAYSNQDVAWDILTDLEKVFLHNPPPGLNWLTDIQEAKTNFILIANQ